MKTTQEALELVLENTPVSVYETLSLAQCFGRVLGENLYTDRPTPPFHRVAMDGIAINRTRWLGDQSRFPVEACQRAGAAKTHLQSHDHCIEVMTGAVLPEGCDAVIPVEQISTKDNCKVLNDGIEIQPWMNIHKMGTDGDQGKLVLKKGQKLFGPQISIAASVGRPKLMVYSQPRINIFSTGDELVPVEVTPLEHQIRQSNPWAIMGSLNLHGFEKFSHEHIPDNPQLLFTRLENSLKTAPVVILSGGVSMGKFDFVPQTLSDLGVKKIFHKVQQKPGKPLWFGVTETGTLVFGLPGNPVSALIGLHKYVLPALKKWTGQLVGPEIVMPLGSKVSFKKAFTHFVAAKLETNQSGEVVATPVSHNGSGDYLSLGDSDGFLELPAECSEFSPGEKYRWTPWQSY